MRSPEMRLVNSGSLYGLINPVQVIAVTGGKGGVGKTSVAVNLAAGLAALGRKVTLLDGDLGLANVDVMLGLSPRYTLAHVLSGERTLDEILIETPQGFSIIPGASGVAELATLDNAAHLHIVQAFSALAQRLDVLVIDTAAGISSSVLQFSQAAQQVLVVVCDEPTSLTDAYGLIKVLTRRHNVSRFHVLCNMVRGAKDGATLFRKLERVTSRFLEISLEHLGDIPLDDCLRHSIRAQRPVLQAFPASQATLAFKRLSRTVTNWPLPAGPRGNIEFFVERLVRAPIAQLSVVS
jgi:flagellar biosynthesis protein FlhG